jgi:hypothetical protein
MERMDMDENIIRWLATGEIGESSKAMAFKALGQDTPNKSYPLDPDDFKRCLKLLKAAPLVRLHFPSIREPSPTWANIIDHWDELEALFIEEAGTDWNTRWSAPRTYARMQELREKSDSRYAIVINANRARKED